MIKDLKDLRSLFKLCRAQGIIDFKMEGLEIKFGDLPMETSAAVSEIDEETDDKLIYWSTPKGQEELDKQVGISS